MPVDERTRRVMTNGLVRALGEEVTDALMAHLPPVGWADVATKKDLEHLASKADLNGLRADWERQLRSAINHQTRTLMFSLVGSNLTVAVIAFGAARFN